jgi:hypothetical protein
MTKKLIYTLLFISLAHLGVAQVEPKLEHMTYEPTNRITFSYRMGFNISGHFSGMGRIPSAQPGHYTDGYVLNDISGNAGGQTWNWGYNNASQVNAGNNTVDMHNYSNKNLPGTSNPDNDGPASGFEITYDRQLGIKEDWHNMAYGVEFAANYTPISFNVNATYSGQVNKNTDTYSYTPGTTPPSAPYQGSYQGPGFVLNVPPSSSTSPTDATMTEHQSFSANLWGFRLGPYVELPITQKLTLHTSTGFALGLLDANASWNETIVIPNEATYTRHGGGSDFTALYGFYVGADAIYQVTKHWGLDAGVQFQNLGTYNHNFGGESAHLDLRQSIFVQAGISYNF